MSTIVKKVEIQIQPIQQSELKLTLIGTTPLYYHAMSAKVKRDLLIGSGKKTAAERKGIKHDPEQEFRDSIYKIRSGPTLLAFPAAGIKQAMATAALETAGVKKTEVQRLIFLPQEKVSVWGTPYMKMDVVRSADMNKTPDIRTRAFLNEWCAEVTIRYALPTFSQHSIVNLLSNAGVICGIGDFRQEKGRGGYGTFQVSDPNDGPFADRIKALKKEGRKVQEAAMNNPQAADDETQELMDELVGERLKRAA